MHWRQSWPKFSARSLGSTCLLHESSRWDFMVTWLGEQAGTANRPGPMSLRRRHEALNQEPSQPNSSTTSATLNPKPIRVVVNMMVPFWVPIMIRPLILKVPKRDHHFDNHPYAGVAQHERFAVPKRSRLPCKPRLEGLEFGV